MKKILLPVVLILLFFSAVSTQASHLFYHGSSFDFQNSGIVPWYPPPPDTSISAFNYSNYSGGITGLHLDIPGVDIAEYSFKTGNTQDPSTWAATSFTSFSGTVGDYDLFWSSGIQNAWLQVTYGSTSFYFGNLVGDVNKDRQVSPIDALLITSYLNANGSGNSVDIHNTMDVNKDGFITPLDDLVVINTINASTPPLSNLSVPLPGSLILLGTGLILACAGKRYRRKEKEVIF